MDAARIFRFAAAGVVILVLALTGLELRQPAPPAPPEPDLAPAKPVASAGQAQLARCQGLGEAGARDAACLAAWAESRRRFLGLPPDLTPNLTKE